MTLSISAGFARPVLMVARSPAKCSTDLVIFDSASRRMGSIISVASPLRANQGADFLAQDYALDVARYQEVEHEDRYVIVHAERDCRVVHDLYASVKHLEIIQVVELDRVGIELRVGRIDTIDLGCLEDHIGFDLDCAERSSRVSGEVRVAGTRGEDHHPAFLEVPHGAAADVRFRDLRHLDGGHRASRYADSFERILKGQSVDDRRQHAHVVACGSIEAQFAGSHATEDVSATHYERYLHSHLMDTLDLAGDRLHDGEIDAVVTRPAKSFTAQLEQHAVVLGRAISHLVHGVLADHASLTLNRANLRTVMFSCSLEMFTAMSSCTVVLASRQCACSSRQLSFRKLSSWPSTIFGMTCSGFPSCCAFAS